MQILTFIGLIVIFCYWCEVTSLTYSSSSYYNTDDLSDLYNLPPYEISALYDFYTSTNGDYWIWSTEPGAGNVWNFSTPNVMPCYDRWQGLTCTFNVTENCYHVENIILDYYNLSGTLPQSIGNFTYLFALSTQFNAIGGQFPPSIGNITGLREINVDGNLLSGSIGSEFCGMTTLLVFVNAQNLFTGTLPECFGSILDLVMLLFDMNMMHGPVPASYANLINLDYLGLSSNYFSGPLPLLPPALSHFGAGGNAFTGSIPEQWGELPLLSNVDIRLNQITGSIPASFGNLTNLQILIVMLNDMSGTLNSNLGNMRSLIGMDLTLNHFTGSIPSTIGPLQPVLVSLDLSHNQFSGSLTANLGQAKDLQVLLLFDNNLSGNLNTCFNASIQTNLSAIDVSSNMFSGSVPSEPFKIQGLLSFAAVSNCIHGSLSSDICQASSLQVLALDGLSTAPACQDRYFTNAKPFSEIHSYGLKYSVTGSIPLCLYNMSNLQTLHLSGNGIVDSLTSDDLVLSPSLQDLSLSHNQFYSSIPVAVQNHSWTNLDLSYNRFDGTLFEDFPTLADSAALSLQVNRLSGHIPSSLVQANNISILDGNLFGCRSDRHDLPDNDPDVDVFECGSNSFNYTIYVWLAIMAVVLCSLAYVKWSSRGVNVHFASGAARSTSYKSEDGQMVSFSTSQLYMKKYQDWVGAFSSVGNNEGIHQLGSFVSLTRQSYVVLTVFVVVLLMPLYIVLTKYYNTYTYEYAWTVTGVYLSGEVPTAVILVVLCIYFGVAVWLFVSLCSSDRSLSNSAEATLASKNEPINYRWYLYITGIILLNIIVVIGANVAYVYIEHHYDSVSVKITQIALAGFKLAWYSLVIRRLLKELQNLMINSDDGEDSTVAKIDAEGRRSVVSQSTTIVDTFNSYTNIEVLIVLFNNLVAPFVAVAFVSSDCFYNVFTSPPEVDASYRYATCEVKTVNAINHTVCEIENDTILKTSYVPPFSYSYQCSSVYITTYAPIFVFTFIIIAFISPLFQCLLVNRVHQWKGSKDSRMYRTLSAMLSPILYTAETINSKRNQVFFECDLFVVRLVNAFSILMTFGTVLPPLAIIGCVAMYGFTYFTQLSVGRFVFNIPQTDTYLHSSLHASINRECDNVFTLLTNSIIMVVPFVSSFFALYLFDMLGSSVGASAALWAPIVVCCLSLMGLLVYVMRRKWFTCSQTVSRGSLGNKLNNKSALNESLGQNLLNNEF